MLFTVYFLNINLKYNIGDTSEIALRKRGESTISVFRVFYPR